MVTIGKADYIQPAMVKLGITHLANVAAEVEQAGAICVPNAFYIGPAFLAVLHCMIFSPLLGGSAFLSLWCLDSNS